MTANSFAAMKTALITGANGGQGGVLAFECQPSRLVVSPNRELMESITWKHVREPLSMRKWRTNDEYANCSEKSLKMSRLRLNAVIAVTSQFLASY